MTFETFRAARELHHQLRGLLLALVVAGLLVDAHRQYLLLCTRHKYLMWQHGLTLKDGILGWLLIRIHQPLVTQFFEQLLYILNLIRELRLHTLTAHAQDVHEVRVHLEHGKALRLLQQGVDDTDEVL